MFHGKPIIAYSIEVARASGLFDGGIYVSTEDIEIGAVAQSLGAKWILRPNELAEVDGAPDPGTQEVARHAILTLMTAGASIDSACCIYPTAPLMELYYLVLGCRVLERNPGAAFAYGVCMEPFGDAGQFYWGRPQAFIDRIPLDPLATNVWKISMPREFVCDINTEEDWRRAEQMYLALQQEEEKVPYG